jgi:manganese/iron transport system substrate-binding protein
MLKSQFWKTLSVFGMVGFLGSCNGGFPALAPRPSATTIPASKGMVRVPKVVATTTVICDLTQQIAANTIDLTCPIKPGIDPHIYEPIPEDRRALENAQLILYGGYGFEPNLIKIIHKIPNSVRKVAVHYGAVALPENTENIDPHIWHNAQNGIRMVNIIQSQLVNVAPNHRALYAKKAQVMIKEIAQIDTWIKTQVATIPATSRRLVTTHDSLGYYSQAYNLPLEGALEGISTKTKPTASRVATLVKVIRDAKVPTIFAELTINSRLIEAVAKDANVKVSNRKLFADGLGPPGSEGDTYQKMLIANTQTIVEGLGGRYKAFPAQ